jgi:hypothetical protein
MTAQGPTGCAFTTTARHRRGEEVFTRTETPTAGLPDVSDLTDAQKAEFLAALDTGDDRAGTDGLRLHFDG